jgi:3-dehydroquinate synthase
VGFPGVFTADLFAPENPVLAETLDRLRGAAAASRARFSRWECRGGESRSLRPDRSVFRPLMRRRWSSPARPQLVRGGEAAKNDFSVVEGFMRLLLELRMDRHSYVVIVGGGRCWMPWVSRQPGASRPASGARSDDGARAE